MNNNPPGCGPWLPPELWVKIFRHLHLRHLLRARLTCQNWKLIIDGCPALKSNIVLRIRIHAPICRRLAKGRYSLAAPNVELTSMRILELPERWWPPIAENLSSLVLLNCDVPLSALMEMLQLAPRLKQLSLLDVKLRETDAVDPGNFRFDQMEQLKLEEMDLTETLPIFGSCFPALKSFKVVELLFGDEEIASVVDFVLKLQNSLECINLETYQRGVIKALREMSGLRLRSLKVHVSGPKSECEVMAFLPTQPALTELDLSGVGLSLKNLTDVGQCLPRLQRIAVNINEPGTTVVPSFLAQMENLREVKLSVDEEISEERRQSILLGELRSPKLRMIYVEHLRVVPADLQKFLQNSPNVHTIAFYCFSCSSWPELFDSVSRLAHVRITFSGVQNQSAYFPNRLENLQTLTLSTSRLSEQQLISLIQQCPHVVNLTLLHMRCVTGDVLETVCAHMKRLQKLTYYQDNAATLSSFMQIIRRGYPPRVWFVRRSRECSGFTAYMN